METRESQYQCATCQQVRNVLIDIDAHAERSKRSPNNIAIFSDIHRCKNGILGINNLQIDHNFHIRSFEEMTLPQRRVAPKHGIPGLPMPIPNKTDDDKNEIKQIVITDMLPEKGFRIAIDDQQLGLTINIGNVNLKMELAICEIVSDLGTIKLRYYPSDIYFSTNLEKGLTVLTNTLEILPPTTLGLFIETLRYIHSLHQTPFTEFHEKQLKTILSSHETYFLPIEDDRSLEDKMTSIKGKYGEELAELMKNLLVYLDENPLVTLQEYAGSYHKDLIFLINAFLIMEQERIIAVERPGIVTDNSHEDD